MIWIASGGTADEDEALLLLPRPFELEGTIIMERVVRMKTLENTFIPEVFKERT